MPFDCSSSCSLLFYYFFFVVEKPNTKERLCIDPSDLNKSILREHNLKKTVEGVAAKVNNAKFYIVLDASNGYWQIKLSIDSQK